MLTYKSNQPGLDLQEAVALGEMINCSETNLIAEDLKSKRSKNGQLKNPIGSKDPK